MRVQTDPGDPPEVIFEEQAAPHGWFLLAIELHEQAQVLFSQNKNIRWTLTTPIAQSQWSGANRASFLLSGFALENMIKAFLIYENPIWIANAQLAKQLKSHGLSELAKKSTMLPTPKGAKEILEIYQSGLTGWARYPCALRFEQEIEPHRLTAELWTRYTTLFDCYGRKMQSLLQTKWIGPHNGERVYEMSGFFDSLDPK